MALEKRKYNSSDFREAEESDWLEGMLGPVNTVAVLKQLLVI